MSLFKPAENLAAFLKCGFYGLQGSGKTFTASILAIGLHRLIKSTKPVFFLDSETGSEWVKPLFDAAKIKLWHHKSGTFSVLKKAMREAPGNTDILIVDSVTHFWNELLSAYLQKKGKGRTQRQFIRIQDWGPIKRAWNEGFTTPFVNSPMHVIFCGRLANIFEDVQEDDDEAEGKFKAIKVGTKMRAETDTGYEPSLLVEMQKVYLKDDGRHTHRAYVRKDRNTDPELTLNDKNADDPTFDFFLPHIKCLALGGTHLGVDTSTTSQDEFDNSGNTEWQRKQRERAAALETVKETISLLFPATKDGKALKAKAIQTLFHSLAWDNEIVSDASKHPLWQCQIAANAVGRLQVRIESDGDFTGALTPETLEKFLKDCIAEYGKRTEETHES